MEYSTFIFFLELSIYIFGDIKMRTSSLSANSIEPGQTAQICHYRFDKTIMIVRSDNKSEANER